MHAFAEDVRARRYPEPEHGYTMAPDERERLRELLESAETATEQDPSAVGGEPPSEDNGGGSPMKRFIRRPSPALVISCIALFVALGGVSYGVATGSIDGREIKNASIRGIDVKNRSLTGSDVAKPTASAAARSRSPPSAR